MKKEELMKIEGMTEELADKLVEAYGTMIPKSRFDEVNEAKKNAEALVKERDTQLEELKKASGDSDALKAQIEELQKANKEAVEAKDAEIKQMKIDTAIEKAITSANGKNAKAIKALLDLENAELTDEGTIKGLDKQLKTLAEAEDSAFLFGSSIPDIKGLQPADSGQTPNAGADFSKMSYSEITEYLASNPDAKLS